MNPSFRSLTLALAGGFLLVNAGCCLGEEKDKYESLRNDLQQRYSSYLDMRFDQPYASTGHPNQKVDVYLPKKPKSDKPLPVIVYIHGGGWVAGDRKSSSAAAVQMAIPGEYAAVSVGYRLSGDAKWPAQIHDCKAAIRWIRAHAKELNIDPDRVGCTGGSAGGHLAALLGVTSDTNALDGEIGDHRDQSSRVRCVVNWSGPVDLFAPLSPGVTVQNYTDPLVAGLLGGSIESRRELATSASVLTYVSKSAVPIMTIHGTRDTAVDFAHAEKLDAALKKAGATSFLIPVVNAGHNVLFGPELHSRVEKFWDQYLRGAAPTEISTEPIITPPPVEPVKK